MIGDDAEPEPTVDDDNWCSDVYHGPRDFNDDDGDCDEVWCDSPVINPGDQNTQNGIDEDPPDALHYDDDGDGMIDEDREGGFSEPETQVVEYLTWRLDIYDDYPQIEYLNDYQNGIIRDNWPEMFVTAPDGDYVRNYRTEAHDMKHNIMNSVSYHSCSALYIWPWGYKDQDPPHELYMENQVKPLMNVTGYGNWKDQGGYKVSGDINDYLYGMQGSFSYTVELNQCGSQGGLTSGFHADPLLIRPTVRMHLLTNIYFMDESQKARIGQMITSDTGNLGIGTINSPEETMMPKLTILSNKDAVEVGFGTDSNVEFDEKKIYSNDDIPVRVNVENAQYLLKDSLKLKYRTEMMPEDIWGEVTMSCITGCDVKDYSNYNNTGGVVVRNSVYEAKIPET
ncbi:MAG: M14 family zinc carboxypeptidase [Candidatus Thermoplasmatota archaeon]|nr:M14 family zinc carboxypeptidase [Candidatus Thermoplasmatota archaeon]